MTELKHGKLAEVLEGQHGFEIGEVVTFIGMTYEEYCEEEVHIFKAEDGRVQHLIECEFKWLEVSA